MKIQYKDNPFFHIIIDEVFSKSVLPLIYEEISLLKNDLKSPDFTGSASNIYSDNFKKNKGIFLNQYEKFDSLKIPFHMDNLIRKVREIKNWKNRTFHRMYTSVEWGDELLNCYIDKDYYLPHIDEGLFSMITFLYKNCKNYTGGDLFFPEYNYLHKCEDNQSIIFFSKELHGVTTFNCNQESCRYSIVTFSSLNENNTNKYKKSEQFSYS
jgi:hypothetical protein